MPLSRALALTSALGAEAAQLRASSLLYDMLDDTHAVLVAET